MKFQLPAEYIKAYLQIAPSKDVRLNINGVMFQRLRDGVLVVVTDRLSMLVHHVRCHVEGPEPVGFQAVVPTTLLKQAKFSKVLAAVISIHAREGSQADVVLDAGSDALNIEGKACEGEYVNWQRVVPHRCSGEPARYCPKAVLAVKEAIRLIGGNSEHFATIQPNGYGPAVVSAKREPEVFGLLHPMRELGPSDYQATLAEILRQGRAS